MYFVPGCCNCGSGCAPAAVNATALCGGTGSPLTGFTFRFSDGRRVTYVPYPSQPDPVRDAAEEMLEALKAWGSYFALPNNRDYISARESTLAVLAKLKPQK
jgi:hypothetical protein